jgi:ABC-type amino acid transport substrate-binding protein
MKNRYTALILCAIMWLGSFASHALAQGKDLDEVIKSGQIKVALYKEFPPFSDVGTGGIDVDLAKLLADRLGVKLEILWFSADENMDDDLRNMVWRGTVLGYGPADVMLHVPIDATYTARNDKAMFFAPYYREKFAIARNVDKLDKLESLDAFRTQRIGVEVETYPATVLLSADGGVYRNNVGNYKSASEALTAMKNGEVSAVMAMQSELEAGLAGTSGYAIADVPLPLVNRRQWVIGLAVKSGNEKLAQSLQAAMNSIAEKGELKEIFTVSSIAPPDAWTAAVSHPAHRVCRRLA